MEVVALNLRRESGAGILASCGRCLYESAEYELAGRIFVAAARATSAHATELQDLKCAGAGAGAVVGWVQGRTRGEWGRKQVSGSRAARLVRDAVRCFRKAGLLSAAVDALVEVGEVCSALQLLKDEHKYDRHVE